MTYHEKLMLPKSLLAMAVSFLLTNIVMAQDNGSIGIGTETPNSNAVLELVSPTNNQGLLVPRLTTAQRTAASFINNLSGLENGLLVFDTDVNAFFFWMNDQWVEVGNTQFSAGQGIAISNGVISNLGDADADPANEIQQLSLVNDSILLSNGGGAVYIDSDESNELQILTFANDSIYLSQGGGAVAIDSSLTNEIQDLSLSGNILTITNNSGATTIDLSPYLDNTDTQQLSLSGNELTIDNGNTIDLSILVDDADADPTNEIQDLTLSASNTLSITGNASATEIDLSPYAGTNTDNQSISFDTGDYSLSIANGNSVDLSPLIDDADADPTNEIELPSTASTGDILVYDGANWVAGTDNVDDGDTDSTNEIELPATATTGDILVYDGANWVAGTDNVDDGDTDPTNEIELPTSATAGDILVFDGANWIPGTDNVDDGDTDSTNEIELPETATNGEVLKYSRGVWGAGTDLTNDADSDPTNEIELPATAGTGDILVYNGTSWVAGTDQVDDGDNDDTNEIELPASATAGDVLVYNGTSWVAGTDQVDDADNSTTNELQGLTYNSVTNLLSISTAGSGSVNLSELDDNFSSPWDEASGVVSYSGSYANANNFVSTPNPELVSLTSGNNSITLEEIKSSKIIQVRGADAANVIAIEEGVDGQELICIVVNAQATFVNQDSGAGTAQLILSATSHSLGTGSTIHLVYNEALGGWLELSYSIAAGRG